MVKILLAKWSRGCAQSIDCQCPYSIECQHPTVQVMMYSNTSEPVQLARDCMAVTVPQGDIVTLPAGTYGYITQALGGSYTVFIDGQLLRIAGTDADALNKEPPAPVVLPQDASDDTVERVIWEQLRTCFDPEIPVNIVELGLIYDVSLSHLPDMPVHRQVAVKMTLTAPSCGMGDILVDDVRAKLAIIPTIQTVNVDLVFDPPWSQHMMSEAARLETGLF